MAIPQPVAFELNTGRVPLNFLPSTLPGLVAWYRADQGITLNGGQVSQWNDLSGQGNTLSQGTTAKQPLWVSNWNNGQPAVYFDVTHGLLSTAAAVNLGGSAGVTAFAVVQQTAASAGAGVILETYTGAGTPTTFGIEVSTGFPPQIVVALYEGGSNYTEEISQANLPMTTPCQLNSTFNASLAAAAGSWGTLRFNRQNVLTTPTVIGAPTASTFSSEILYVGERGSNNTFPFFGFIAEIVVCNQIQPAQWIAAYESYAQKLWGLP